MTWFGRLSKSFRARKGRSWILTLTPPLRNSSERKSASNTPNRTTVLRARFSELIGIEKGVDSGEVASLPLKQLTAQADFVSLRVSFEAALGLSSQVTTPRIVLQRNPLARHTHCTNASRPEH